LSPTNASYQITTRVPLAYEDTVTRVTAELKKEGFGVLTEIDVKATFKKKLDVDYTPYIILGACNPTSAYKALNAEIEIGLLLPCNVIVYEDNGETVVSAVDPVVMLGVVQNPELDAIANDIQARLQRVIASTAV
jgi:uncharacterized protein (DUF302 family)